MNHYILSALILITTLSGCSGLYSHKYEAREAPKGDPTKSKALQIAQASGIGKGLRDVPAEELDKFRGPYGDAPVPGAYLAAGTIGQIIDPMPGTGYGLSSTMSLINFFDVRLVLARDNRVISWVPQSEVDRSGTSYPPSVGAFAFQEALAQALPKGFVLEPTDQSHYVVRSPSGSNAFTLNMYSEGRPHILKFNDSSDTKNVRYVLKGGISLKFEELNLVEIGGNAELFKIFQRASAAGPDWLYLYLAPGRGLSTLPVILNKRKLLYFEMPESHKSGARP